MSRQTKTDPRKEGSATGAEDGIRTRDLLLGKEMLYQLSHFRICFEPHSARWSNSNCTLIRVSRRAGSPQRPAFLTDAERARSDVGALSPRTNEWSAAGGVVDAYAQRAI